MMNDPLIIEWARYYASLGWRLFPVHGYSRERGCTCGDGAACSNAGKHPATKNGLLDATSDEEKIEAFFGRGNRNIGLATGAASGVWVLDIDGPDGQASIRALEAKNGTLPVTLTSLTGRGSHLFFRAPPGVRIKSTVKKLGRNLDIRGDGGYVVAPPSHHMSGTLYKFVDPRTPIVDAPDWLLSEVIAATPTEVAKADVAARGVETGILPGSYKHAVMRSMLDAIDPDLPYDDWVKVGMALKATGGQFALWDAWSARGEKYVPEEMSSKWNSFRTPAGGVSEGTLAQIAEAHGWVDQTSVDLDAIIANFSAPVMTYSTEAYDEEAPTERPRLPINPVELPGLIGRTVEWILQTSMQPQPELALSATLAAVAGVVGRKYRTEHNTRCNVYICGLAPTGAGKDHARKKIRELFHDAGLADDYLGKEEFVSAPGALNAIEDQPSQVMLIDELGAMFKSLSGQTTASFRKDIVTLLMKAFSSSGSRAFSGGVYAERKREAPVIDFPALSIYGTSTENSYADSLSEELVHSGELNRWLIIPAPNELPMRNYDVGLSDPPEALRDMWMALRIAERPPETQTDITSYTSPVGVRPPISVDYAADAATKIRDIWAEQDSKRTDTETTKGSLHARMAEQIIKVAMLFAICRRPAAPVITIEDLSVGRAIVMTSINYTTYLVENRMSNSLYEKVYKAIYSYIKEGGETGRSKTDICRRFRGYKARERDDVIAALLEERAVLAETEESTGRWSLRYFAAPTVTRLTVVGGSETI